MRLGFKSWHIPWLHWVTDPESKCCALFVPQFPSLFNGAISQGGLEAQIWKL